jgi:hypothetical protein
VTVEPKRTSTLLAVVAATGLFLLVSGVGPVFLWNLSVIAGLAAVLATAVCAIYPQLTAALLVSCAALYPYFLSRCSDVPQSGADAGALGSLTAGFPCVLSPGESILSMLLVGVPGALAYGVPLAGASYLGATAIRTRIRDEQRPL